MTVLIIDGPEKAGKTTIINKVMDQLGPQFPVTYRHWGPVSGDHEYSDLLKKDTASGELFIWDRGWPSEYVYGRLLNRTNHRMTTDPWIGEWCHGRAVQANGMRLMLLGPKDRSKLVDKTDLVVDQEMERSLYEEYATRFGWVIVENEHDKESSQTIADLLTRAARSLVLAAQMLPKPPQWAGLHDAPVVVVGEKRSDQTIPGGWLPFTSRLTTLLGREIGDDAITKTAWVNAHDCPPASLSEARIIITCGLKAFNWIMNYGKELKGEIVTIHHPSYVYRFNTPKTLETRERVKNTLKKVYQTIRQGDKNA